MTKNEDIYPGYRRIYKCTNQWDKKPKPKIKPLTPEETKAEWQSMLDAVKRISEQPPDNIVYRCPLCSIETGKYIDDWINHLAQKHTTLELAQYIADEDYRHDD